MSAMFVCDPFTGRQVRMGFMIGLTELDLLSSNSLGSTKTLEVILNTKR